MAVPHALRLGIVTVGLALLPVPGAVATPENGMCVGPQPTFDIAAERSLRAMTNAFRAERGLRPLRAAARLTRIARNHSLRMARTEVFGHSGTSRGFPWSPSRAAGENLALAGSPGAVMQLWKGSPAHREALLSPAFRRFGIGVLRTCTGYLLVTGDFTA